MTLTRALSAELVRTRRTTTAWLILAGVVLSILQGLGWAFLSSRDLTAWHQLLGWQVSYVTGLCVPLVALVGALAVGRDRRSRDGGTTWRAPSPTLVRLARALVAAGVLLGFHLALFLPTLVWGLIGGLSDPPVARVVGLAVLCWAVSLPALALGLWLTRWFGLVTTLLVSIAWQVAGTLQAESGYWWAQPWTWQVRPMLPLLGIHQNGVKLEPGSPVWAYAWWPPLLASAGLTAALLLVDRWDRPRFGGGRGATQAIRSRSVVVPVTRVTPRPVLGLAATLRRTALPWLALGVVALLLLVALGWGGNGVRGIVGYLVLPIGSCLLAVLSWQVQADVWRSLATRRPVPTLGGQLLIVCALLVVGLSVLAAVIVGVRGGDHALEFGIVAALSGMAGVAFFLWLTTRFGAGAAIGVMLVALVTSLIFGGFFAETPLWVLGPAAWAYSATGTTRAVLAGALSVVALAGVVPLWFGAVRRQLAGG